MCGDLEDEADHDKLEEMLVARFAAHVRTLLAQAQPPGQSAADTAGYMEALFNQALGGALRDCTEVRPERRYERMIAQPVVYARLAGFLAGHMALGEDPLRRVMEALMLGYSEAEAMDRERRDYDHGDVAVRP